MLMNDPKRGRHSPTQLQVALKQGKTPPRGAEPLRKKVEHTFPEGSLRPRGRNWGTAGLCVPFISGDESSRQVTPKGGVRQEA